MTTKEPQIITAGLSNNELHQWMKDKVTAGNRLQKLIEHKAFLLEQLEAAEKDISAMTQAASIEIVTSPTPAVDARTLRDIAVLNYILSKPTGDPVKDAANAALIKEHNAGILNGTIVCFVSDEAPQVILARRALGQIT